MRGAKGPLAPTPNLVPDNGNRRNHRRLHPTSSVQLRSSSQALWARPPSLLPVGFSMRSSWFVWPLLSQRTAEWMKTVDGRCPPGPCSCAVPARRRGCTPLGRRVPRRQSPASPGSPAPRTRGAWSAGAACGHETPIVWVWEGRLRWRRTGGFEVRTNVPSGRPPAEHPRCFVSRCSLHAWDDGVGGRGTRAVGVCGWLRGGLYYQVAPPGSCLA